jgi:formamidopyrimidine-DNA glycosylase
VPELPEAECIARSLAPFLAGRRIASARFLTVRVRRGEIPELGGRTVTGVRRYGKQVLLELDHGLLFVRLGMTGRLLRDAAPGPYTRAVFDLDPGTLCFDDVRQFGSIEWRAGPPPTLGPDPLELTASQFAGRLRARRAIVKRLLLDQRFVRGLGNIYADEALFRAGIHPKARSHRIAPARAAGLHAAIVAVLEAAIAAGGSSISDYIDGAGRRGSYQEQHQVYGKEGAACPRCGTALRRIVVAQRGTQFCPHCQRV